MSDDDSPRRMLDEMAAIAARFERRHGRQPIGVRASRMAVVKLRMRFGRKPGADDPSAPPSLMPPIEGLPVWLDESLEGEDMRFVYSEGEIPR